MPHLKGDLDQIKQKYRDQVVIVEGTTKNYVWVIALVSLAVTVIQAGGSFLIGAAEDYATKEWVQSRIVKSPASIEDVDRKIQGDSPWIRDRAAVLLRIQNLETYYKESTKEIVSELKEIRQIISENHPRRQAKARGSS